MRCAEGQCLREPLLECPPPEWCDADEWEDPRGARECDEEKCEDETRGVEKCCGDEYAREKCCGDFCAAAKRDTVAGVRADGAALRKLEFIRGGIALASLRLFCGKRPLFDATPDRYASAPTGLELSAIRLPGCNPRPTADDDGLNAGLPPPKPRHPSEAERPEATEPEGAKLEAERREELRRAPKSAPRYRAVTDPLE